MPGDYYRILPEPLSYEKERILTDRFGTSQEEDAKQELICHNLRLVIYYAKRFSYGKESEEELIQEGAIGLIKAVKSYRPGPGKRLVVYASRCIVNQMLMYLRKRKPALADLDIVLVSKKQTYRLLLEEYTISDPEKEILEEERIILLRKAVSMLSCNEQILLRMRYGLAGEPGTDPFTQKETAAVLHTSQTAVCRREKMILRKLKKNLSIYMAN